MSRRIFLIFVVVLLIVIGLAPILSMLIKSVYSDGHITFKFYKGILTSAHQQRLMRNSLTLASIVTILTIIIGVPLGVLFGKTNFPVKNFFVTIFVIPLLIPPYIIAVSWLDFIGKGGLIEHIFGSNITNITTHYLFGLAGCVIVLFSIFLPIPMLLTIIFLKTVNPRLEESAKLVSNWKYVISQITIPLIAPGIMLSALLVFLLTLGEFTVPNFLRYDVFPVESFTQFSAFYNFQAATAAAVPLAGITLILLGIESFFLKNKTYQLRPVSSDEQYHTIELRRSKIVLLIAVISVLAILVVIAPIGVLVIKSANIEAYTDAINRGADSLLRSLIYASIGASFLTILGFFTGYLIQTKSLRCWRSVDSLTFFLFALPSTVIGIGLISLWNTKSTNFIYATPAIIILGYVAKYIALTSRISVTQLALIPPSMEQAAEISGANWFRRILFICIPLARPGIIASWFVGYIFSLRDTGITMLVYPPGHETLPVRIFTLMANGKQELIAALCVIMIGATLIPLACLCIIYKIAKWKADR